MTIKTNIIIGDSIGSFPYRQNGLLKFSERGTNSNLYIYQEELERDMLIVGGIGTGKTNVFLHTISQIKSNLGPNDVMLVFDSKQDFRVFHTKDDVVLTNSTINNSNTAIWNIFMDIVADGWDKDSICHNAMEVSELIFFDEIEKSHAPFFPTAARDIFAAIIEAISFVGITNPEHRIKYMNNKALRKYLNKVDAAMLINFLSQYEETRGALKYIGNGKSEQALGVLAELQSVTNQLFLKNFGGDGRFSIRQFERERKGRTVFLEYDLSTGYSLRSVYRVFMDMFIKEALSKSKQGNIYLICDEMKLIPHLLHLEDALNFGRSLGVTVIAGIQSLEQLYEVYGEVSGRNIASAFQTTICFYTNNIATRDFISSLYGKHYVSRQYIDANNKVVTEENTENVVEDWDIVGLDFGEAIIGLPYQSPFRFKFERFR